jgi:hypothetical protein
MADKEQPWYAAYPQAQSSPEAISRGDLLALLKQNKEDKKIVLVDLRRTDYEVHSPRTDALLRPWSLIYITC